MATATAEPEVISVVSNLIIKSIELISFNGTDASPLLDEITSDPNVHQFITSYSVSVLIVTWSRRQTNAKLQISTNVLQEWLSNCNSVTITKNEAAIITKENVQRVLSIQCCPAAPDLATQFKRSLKSLFIPYFSGKQSQIAKTLATLHGEIDAFETTAAENDGELSRISTIDDEIRCVSFTQIAAYSPPKTCVSHSAFGNPSNAPVAARGRFMSCWLR